MREAGRSSPRPPWAPRLHRRWEAAFDFGSAGIIAVVLAMVFATFRDYGVTWDETWHLVYGDYILSWFETGGADTSALCYRIDYLYGGGFDLAGAILRRISPMSDFETIHLFGALVGVLGLWGVHRLATRLAGPAAGFIAVALLATTPVYYGHMFANPKDVPFAVGYVWALDALVEIVLCVPRVPRRVWIRFAVLAGLAMGVRIAGILLLIYLAGVVVGLAWLRARRTRSLDAGLVTARRLGLPAALSMLGAWVVMLSTWPWGLLDPIRRPWMALGRMSRFTVHTRTMPFAGEQMLTTEPRWDYLLHYFGLKLPLPVLLLVVAGVVLMVMALRRPYGLDGISRAKRNVVLVIGAAILAPPAYAIVVRSVVYDGLRHFLFLVPPLIVMAAVTAVVLPRLITRSRGIVVAVLALALTGMLGRQIHAMVQLHPYQYIYFNELIGGMPGASGNYDTDYYGASYKEGFRALTEHLWKVDRDNFLDRRYTVAGCIPGLVARNYIEGSLVWVDSVADDPRFYLGYTRSDCHERHGMRPEFHRVERMDTLLLMIRDLHEGRGKLPPALRPRPSSPPDAAP